MRKGSDVQPAQNHRQSATQRDVIQRVLIVDDSHLQLRLMRRMLENWGLEVVAADSGQTALESCADRMPDLVLSDWMMPGMDGLEFCRRFREAHGDTYVYFILLTSKSDKDDVAQGLDAGADDFLTKPVSAPELRARMNAAGRLLSMQRLLTERNDQLRDALEELQRAHDAIDRDLRQARKIQQSLVPERTGRFGGSQVSLLLKPCGHVGGDLVGMFAAEKRKLGLYSIDVSGHGLTSAMVTARVAGYLSGRFPEQNIALDRQLDGHFAMWSPDETVRRLNERLLADPGVEEYLTLAFLSADLATGHIELVQAGHPPPLLLTAEKRLIFLGDGGLPVGLFEGADYDTLRTRLNPDDKLLLYSDGLTEAVLGNGEMLGEEGLAHLFESCAQTAHGVELLEDMFWQLSAQMPDGVLLGDDVSAVLLEFQPDDARPDQAPDSV